MIAAISVLSVLVIISISNKDIWDKNAKLLRQEVLAVGESAEMVNLTEVTPFEWDTVYSFEPYTPKEMIYETVGYKWDRIAETMNEGMHQIVFMKEGKVVCYVYGYPDSNDYGINFTNKNSVELVVSVLRADDDLIFQVEKREDVVLLEHF